MAQLVHARQSQLCGLDPMHRQPHTNGLAKRPSPNPSQPSPKITFDGRDWASKPAHTSTPPGGDAWRVDDAPSRSSPTRGSHALYRSSEPDSWRRGHTQDVPDEPFSRASNRAQLPFRAIGRPSGNPSQSLNGSLDRMFRLNSPSPPSQSSSNGLSGIYSPSSNGLKTDDTPNYGSLSRQLGSTGIPQYQWPAKAQTQRASRLNAPPMLLDDSFFASPPASVGTPEFSTHTGLPQAPSQKAPTGPSAMSSSPHSPNPSARPSVNGGNGRSFQKGPDYFKFSNPVWPPVPAHYMGLEDTLSDSTFGSSGTPLPSLPFIDFSTKEVVLEPFARVSRGGVSQQHHTAPRSAKANDQQRLKTRSDFQVPWSSYDMCNGAVWGAPQRAGPPYPDAADSLPPMQFGFPTPVGTDLSPYVAAHMSPYGQIVMPPQPVEGGVETPQSLRSTCLAEFRNTIKGSRRWELRDIYNHVVEFTGDHHGSLFIQSKLEKAKTDEKEMIFREIQPNSVPLMKDVFGNYVLQKFFEHGDHLQKKTLVSQMKGQVAELSKHVYGCRVVQTALNHILVEQQAALVQELESCVMECVKNENGNHVIQIAIRVVPMQFLQTMIDQFYGHIQYLATHRYGCRVIQRLLEYCKAPVVSRILQELHECSSQLIADQYGNYVPQHILEFGDLADRNRIIDIVQRNLIMYSKQKFASNVVEKCVKFGTDEQRRQIMIQLLQQDEREHRQLLCFLIRDGYGNYVVQSLLDHLNDGDYAEFVRSLEPALTRARQPAPNKQSENVAKKMQRLKTPRFGWDCTPGTGPRFGNYTGFRSLPPPINTQTSTGRSIPSAAPTPPLTVGSTESPLSNAFPSMTDMSRQDSRKDPREWRKDSAINIESPEHSLKA